MRGFRRSVGIAAAGIMLLSMMSATMGATAAQDETEAPAGEQLFSADGVDATIVTQAEIGQLDTGSSLLLELIEVAPDTELPLHNTTSPELFYILSGVVIFQDNFGFASVVEAGSDVSLNPGTEYTIANQESEPGRLLRLRLTSAESGAATPGATPVTAGGEATVLVQAPLQDLQVESASLYLARVQFGAGADSGEQGHDGPIGLYVDSGALNVVSPSGLVGAIGEGQAVSLPAETPLQASTGESEAVAFIAGVGGPESAAFLEMSPAEAGTTEPGSVLESGQIWRTETAEMAVDSNQHDNSMRFSITYINTAASEREFSRTSSIQVTDDAGGTWVGASSDCPRQETLEPGGSITCAFTLYPPSSAAPGPLVLMVTVESFGDIQDARWQAAIDW